MPMRSSESEDSENFQKRIRKPGHFKLMTAFCVVSFW